MKNSNDTIGNRTRDLPSYSSVPQPTASPRVLHKLQVETEVSIVFDDVVTPQDDFYYFSY